MSPKRQDDRRHLIRMVRVTIGCAALALAGLTLAATGQPNTLRTPGTPGTLGTLGTLRSQSPSPHRTLLTRYCVTCHNQRLATANLMLDTVDVDAITRANAAVWETVVRKLRAGQMPPAGVPRPDQAASDSLATYLETALDRLAAEAPDPGRRQAFHRLNRAEYTNAIRDLLALEIDGTALLPADEASHGFDNVGEMLAVSPVLVERYVAAAGRISRLAVGDVRMRPSTESYEVSPRLLQEDRISDDLPFGSRGGIAVRAYLPLDGEYAVKVRLQRNKDNYIRGLGEPHQFDVRLDGALVRRFTVGGAHKGRSGVMNTFSDYGFWGDPEQQQYEFLADADLEVRFSAKAGTRLVGVAFLEETFEPESEALPRQSYAELVPSGYKGGSPAVDSISISGPFDATGVGDTPSRRRIFVCRLPDGASRGAEEPCAERILSTLARRAYRRPATREELDTLLGFFRKGRSDGFDAGIGLALQRVLVSPAFLFRSERDPANVRSGSVYRVSDLDLASRLSFFLWSSIPDDELLDLAEKGRLSDPAVLERQVRRMLADSRSKALVQNFAGQWLSLRDVQALSPDPKASPDFDENLKEALYRETELFFQSVLRENRSVLDLLGADYTFLNERLAQHYGIPDVFGSHFRRVAVTDERRKGLLGHGSILSVTSYANRTAPTLRGAWILENLLGTPPPPPPPDVPVLNEDDRGAADRPLTMRERMDRHRVNAVCASCHRVMDPLGFALENFDSLGKWRDTYNGTPIDASAALADGTTFDGPAGLRTALLGRRHQFVHTFTEKLLTYALGRGVEYYDGPTVRTIMREAAADRYRIGSLIAGIVRSVPFQMRRSRPS